MNSALEKARKRREEMREAGESIERLNPIEKARRNPNSLRLAVNAKCWECMGGGLDPGTVRLIRECAAPDCPLWPVRPYRDKEAA